jgi:chromate reductase
MRLVGISGSLREGSYNTALLAAAAALLPAGVEFEQWNGLAGLPAFDEDRDGRAPNPAVAALRRTLCAADAVLIATPEYNGSIPGALKNALDWASRPYPGNCLRGKPVAVIGATTGMFGAAWAQADLRRILTTIGATILEPALALSAARDAFSADGSLLGTEPAAALRAVVEGLLVETRARAA